MPKDPSPLQVRLMSPIRLDMRDEYDLLTAAVAMAQAINHFRNLALLDNKYGVILRKTAAYGEMQAAWENFRDLYGMDMAVHPKVKEASEKLRRRGK